MIIICFLNFFNVVVGVFFILNTVQATEDDDYPPSLQGIMSPQSAGQAHAPILSSTTDGAFQVLPDELIQSVFEFLDVNILGRVAQVCKRWKSVCEEPTLWRSVGSKYYGDYLSEEDFRPNPKQMVIWHYLSVIVNVTEHIIEMVRLVNKYRLNLFLPQFRKYPRQIIKLAIINNLNKMNYSPLLFEESIALDNDEVIEEYMRHFYSPNAYIMGVNDHYKNARKWNDLLVMRRNLKAIERKILGLTSGKIAVPVFGGYCHTTVPLGYVHLYGYEQNLSEARDFIELLVKEENPLAIERKINGLGQGNYGYKKDLPALRRLNDLLVEKGNIEAIKRKVEGLGEGKYGYERNLTALGEFNDLLVEKGDIEAIKRKVEGLREGKYGYQRNLTALGAFNDLLVQEGNPGIIERKMENLLKETDRVRTKYDYTVDPSVREFIESLLMHDVAVARVIGNYIKAFAMKYGVFMLGYEQDRAKATEFIKANHIPY